LHLARDRKERGNPPGKRDNPLGDQITWEQLLTYCKGMKRIWIITGDDDYGIKYAKTRLLNSLLRRDLMHACAELEINYFDNWSEGMTDFRKSVGVTTDKLPLPERVEEIKNNEEALSHSPLDWLTGGEASASAAIIAAHQQRRNMAAILTGSTGIYG
jgi:hypothetical protein